MKVYMLSTSRTAATFLSMLFTYARRCGGADRHQHTVSTPGVLIEANVKMLDGVAVYGRRRGGGRKSSQWRTSLREAGDDKVYDVDRCFAWQ